MIRRFCLLLCLSLAAALAGAQELLPPALAFKPSAQALDGRTVELRFDIAPGYYLYRDKLRFAAEPATLRLGAPQLPPGESKDDETFGRVEVYYGAATIRLPVVRDTAGELALRLAVVSQGCAEAGVCYPPQRHLLDVVLPDPAAPAAPASADEAGRIAGLFDGASVGWVLLSFFGFGVLLSLTPCVFPMLPILSGVIVGAGRNGRVTRARGFALSLAYVLGMAAAYAAAGVAAGLSGALLTVALQNAWVLGSFALLFVVLALSMFGLYELQLPAWLQSGASRESARLKGGSLPAVAAMGVLSALIVGPCVAAPLAGALLYIGRSGDAVLGGLALFCLALGMGLPLLVVGVSAGALLPRAGAWMESVRKACGVILLATAVWIVSPLIPVAVQMAAWAALLIVSAIHLRAIDPLSPHAGPRARLAKALGILLLLLGVAQLVGALSGASDPLRPLAGLRGGPAAAERPLPFERVRNVNELDARLASAGVPVMLDFYADWCVSCKEMERYTFADPRVRERLAGWRLLQADVTANSADDQALLARFGLFGPPGLIFFDAAGREIAGVRVVGYQDADAFLATLAATRQ